MESGIADGTVQPDQFGELRRAANQHHVQCVWNDLSYAGEQSTRDTVRITVALLAILPHSTKHVIPHYRILEKLGRREYPAPLLRPGCSLHGRIEETTSFRIPVAVACVRMTGAFRTRLRSAPAAPSLR